MLERISNSLTNKLYIAQPRLDKSKKAIYKYGLELLFSTVMGMLSILVISIAIFDITYAIAFFLNFIGLRFFSGGYHAKTYGKCFLISNCVYLLSALIGKSLYATHSYFMVMGIAALSVGLIIVLAPVKSVKHPLSKKIYQKNRTTARIYVLVAFFLIIVLFGTNTSMEFACVCSMSLLAVMVMMITANVEKYLERRQKNGNNSIDDCKTD